MALYSINKINFAFETVPHAKMFLILQRTKRYRHPAQSTPFNLLYFPIRQFTSQNVSKPSVSASWSVKLPTVSSKEILKELWPLIWPKGDWKSRAKVGGALSLLLGGKV